MDYNEVHDAALTFGRKVIEKNPELKDWAFQIMPELRTTEEQDLIEKIINLIQEVQTDEDWHIGKWSDDAIEWLRAKREIIGQHTEQRKFKIGDYVVGKFLRGRVTVITDDAYLLDTEMGFPVTEEENVHLWSLDDCQTGDVISSDESSVIILFKKWKDISKGEAIAYAGIDGKGCLQITDNDDEHWTLNGNIRIATREENAALKTMLQDDGYEWDAANLNLSSLELPDLSNLTAGIVSAEESLGISSEDFNRIVDKCIYGDDDDPCESCEHPKLNCHNFPCWKKQNYIKNCNSKPITITWHTLEEKPKYPCDILFVSNVENVFLYRYMEDGKPVDHTTPYFRNLIDGKWCNCKDIISGEPHRIWSKEAVISALTEELTKRIKPLHEKSLNKSLNETEYGCLGGLVELRSYINSPEFKIGDETKQTAWTAHDNTMLIYARKYLDDILHQTPSEEQQQEIIDAMDWLSGIKAANKKTGNINVDEMVADRSRKTGSYRAKTDYRDGIEDTLNKLNEK